MKESVVNVISLRVSKGHFPMCLQRTRGDNNIKYGDSLAKWHWSEWGPEIMADVVSWLYRLFIGNQETIYFLSHLKRKLTNIHISCSKTLLSNIWDYSLFTHILWMRDCFTISSAVTRIFEFHQSCSSVNHHLWSSALHSICPVLLPDSKGW